MLHAVNGIDCCTWNVGTIGAVGAAVLGAAVGTSVRMPWPIRIVSIEMSPV
jgi:hypothetical protein